MAKEFNPLRTIPPESTWSRGDFMVVFGELFSRGYVNGIVEEAERRGMNVIFSTVGRRGPDDLLRPLTADELQEKQSPVLNIPLEAGFDLAPSKRGVTPVSQLEGIKLSEWLQAKMNWSDVEESRQNGIENFCSRVSQYMKALEDQIPDTANVLFVHTMAGGVPRAKIAMPAMNRVFKGVGDRYASSVEFWKSDLGRFCALSFMEVTGNTFRHLIDLSKPLRERQERNQRKVSYVAYGYHGTEVLVNDKYQWQSYSPYLQGFAKIELESIASEAFKNSIKACVFNAPEILTNSSSVFLGVEVSLYPLLAALRREGKGNAKTEAIITSCIALLKPGTTVDSIITLANKYFSSDVIRRWSDFENWPQHNGPEQMSLMRSASSELIELHADPKHLITSILSEAVFKACGSIMFHESASPKAPVWWIGHDMVAKQTAASD